MDNNRDLFTGNLAAEPELNCPPKGTAVVNASLANKELYTSEDSDSLRAFRKRSPLLNNL
jgi:hypothetical protein